jgi:hypothetical protein
MAIVRGYHVLKRFGILNRNAVPFNHVKNSRQICQDLN